MRRAQAVWPAPFQAGLGHVGKRGGGEADVGRGGRACRNVNVHGPVQGEDTEGIIGWREGGVNEALGRRAGGIEGGNRA